MTQNAKTTFWEESHSVGAVGRAPQRANCSIGQSFEVLGEPVSRLTFGPRHFVEVLVFNGLWPRGLRHGPKDVGEAAVGRCLALLGPVGWCAFAHGVHALECYEEVRAARSALLLPFRERADGPQGVGWIRAVHLSRKK